MQEGPFGTTDHGAGAGGVTGISNKGGGGGGGGDGSSSSKKKPAGTASGKNQAAKGGKKGKGVAKGKGGKTVAAAAAAGGVANKAKKQPAKKPAGRKKKQNEWSTSENDEVEVEVEVEEEEEEEEEEKEGNEGTTTTNHADPATEGEDIEIELTANKPSSSTPAAGTAANTSNGNGNATTEVIDLLHDEEEKKKKNEIVSGNAYLLVYRRRGLDLSSPMSALTTENGLRFGAVLETETAQWLLDSKARLAEEFEKQCEAYQTAKADAEKQQTARRQEVRNLLESAACYGNTSTSNGGGEGIHTCNGISDGPVPIEDKEGEIIANEEEEEEGEGKTAGPRGTNNNRTKIATPLTTIKTPIMPDGDCGRFISATWLQQWADAPASSPPPPIDNAPLLCPHGKLDPSRPTVMRRLPTHAWTALASNYRGGPELKPSDACPMCLGEVLDGIAAKEDSTEARDYYLDIADLILSSLNSTIEREEQEDDEIEAGSEEKSDVEIIMEDNEDEGEEEKNGHSSGRRRRRGASKKTTTTLTPTPPAAAAPPAGNKILGGVPAYYVSKPWFQAWHRRGGKSMGTTPPTQSLCCPHGGLVPEPVSLNSAPSATTPTAITKGGGGGGGSKSSKRIGISDDFWAFFKRSWQFSETERLRKVRVKALDKLRKNQGGAAVIDGEKETDVDKKEGKEEEEEIEVIEIDGEQVLIPKEKNENGRKRDSTHQDEKEKHSNDADAAIEILDSPKAAAAVGAVGVDINTATLPNNDTNVSSATIEITPLPEFPVETKECAICRADIEEAARLSRGLHSRVQAEKASLSHLIVPGFVQLTQGETYYLIPREFMEHWRAYMTQASAGRRGAAAAAAAAVAAAGVAAAGNTNNNINTTTAPGDILEAPKLSQYMQRAACDCHSNPPLLAFDPPAVINRRGRWLVVNNLENNNASTPGGAGGGRGTNSAAANGANIEDPLGFFELISLADWSAFVEHYAEEDLVFGVEGISATLQIEDITINDTTINAATQEPVKGEVKENDEEREKKVMAAAEKKSSDKDSDGDVAMPDAPAADTITTTTTTIPDTTTTRRTQSKEEVVDEDALLANALAVVEEEEAIENDEIETETDDKEKQEEKDDGGKKKSRSRKNNSRNKNKKKSHINFNNDDDDDDFVPASQLDDEGTVFGQDPDFLYDRKPGTGNAHLRPGAAGKAWLISKPGTCTATIEARNVALKAARLSYIGAEIMVEVCLTDDEAISATLAAVVAASAATGRAGKSGAVGGGGGSTGEVLGERKSKRARKGRAPVTVDCTSTLHDLRLRIYQAIGVHPRNARLYYRGQMISDKDEITLSELEIYPNEEIRVVDTQEHDPDDLTGLFLSSPTGKKGRRGGPEGFGGTALTGLHLVESNAYVGGGGGGEDTYGDIQME
jgi:hypothetical protein